jgi:hypothetical protein
MVNLGNLYVQGGAISFVSGTSITIAAGQFRDSTNVNDIVLSSAATIIASANGANGLDVGTLGNNTLYAVYVIGDSTGFNATAGLLSASFSAPTLPAGYDMFRRIGAVLTSGAAAILDFSQSGRTMWYAAAIATAVNAGASTVFALVNVSAMVPSTANSVILESVLTADVGATRTAALKASGSSSAAGQVVMSSPAGTVTSTSLVCPCSTITDTTGVDYLVSNAAAALAVSVFGYVDQL